MVPTMENEKKKDKRNWDIILAPYLIDHLFLVLCKMYYSYYFVASMNHKYYQEPFDFYQGINSSLTAPAGTSHAVVSSVHILPCDDQKLQQVCPISF